MFCQTYSTVNEALSKSIPEFAHFSKEKTKKKDCFNG
jgi:hypothetical protein